MDSLHQIQVKTITGESRTLSDFAGKALLIVNVAGLLIFVETPGTMITTSNTSPLSAGERIGVV